MYAKIKGNHALMMVLCCVVPVLALLSAVKVFGLGQQWLFWGFIVLCPLMHIIMMRHHAGKQEGGCHARPKKESAVRESWWQGSRMRSIGLALFFLALTIIMLWAMHPEWR